jgi:hypothetical protein
MLLTEKDRENMAAFKRQLNLIKQVENVPYHELCVITGLNPQILMRCFRDETGLTVATTLKILTALGYEMCFVKKNQRLGIGDIPGGVERMNELKEKSNVYRKRTATKSKDRRRNILDSKEKDDLFSTD